MRDAAPGRLAAAIHGLVRAVGAATPAPRALPYLGLEHASGTGFHLLDALAARGIFRKYERVLELGAGLGGASRWLATRLGCEVVGTAASVEEAAAGSELTRRVGLTEQVRLVPATAALPFANGRFTHVWIVETLPRLADGEAALREAFRVLRPGGSLALQDLVLPAASPGVSLGGWSPRTLAARTQALATAGFADVDVRDRTAEAGERSARVVAARAQLLESLRGDPELGGFAAERESLARALASGALRVVQVLARRP